MKAARSGNIAGIAEFGKTAVQGAVTDPEKRAALAKAAAARAGQDEDFAAEMAGSDAFGEGADMLADGDFDGMAEFGKTAAQGAVAAKMGDSDLFPDESIEEGGISDEESDLETDDEYSDSESESDEDLSFEEAEFNPEKMNAEELFA